MKRFYVRTIIVFALWLSVSLAFAFYRTSLSLDMVIKDESAVVADEILALSAPSTLFVHAYIFELGFISLFIGIFALIDRLIANKPLRRLWRGGNLAFLVIFLTYNHLNRELLHWLGQYITWSFVTTYKGAILQPLTWQVLGSEGNGTWISGGILISLWLSAFWAGMSMPTNKKAPVLWILLFCVCGVVFAAYHYVRPTNPGFIHRIEPGAVVITKRAANRVLGKSKPKDPAQAALDLYAMARSDFFLKDITRPAEEALKYPLWRDDNTGQLSVDDFKRLPLAERPDIIFVIVETWRGWETGFAPNDSSNGSPGLYGIFENEGAYFPYTHSTGYPSVNGVMGLHLGLWPDPEGNIITTHANTRTKSFTEYLSEAGYETSMLVGINPDYDNLTKPLSRWYDTLEIDIYAGNDERLVDRFLERYDTRDHSKPQLLALRTMTTHPPYRHPDDSKAEHKKMHLDEAYRRVIRYTDKELARLVDHLREKPDWDRTLVFFVGDHAQPTEYQQDEKSQFGGTTVGRTWTALGITGGWLSEELHGRHLVQINHADIPPTILSMLNLRAMNHFMGRNLVSVVGSSSDESLQSASTLTVGNEIFTVHEKNRRILVHTTKDVDYLKLIESGNVESYGELSVQEFKLVVGDQDDVPIARWKDAMRAYQQVLREDRLLPP